MPRGIFDLEPNARRNAVYRYGDPPGERITMEIRPQSRFRTAAMDRIASGGGTRQATGGGGVLGQRQSASAAAALSGNDGTAGWKRQLNLARTNSVTPDGRRLAGNGRGLFTRDRVRRQPTRLERMTDAQVAIEREKNRGVLGSEQIRAGAQRYGTDAAVQIAGMQDSTARRGQDVTGGLGLAQIAGQKDIAGMESETARRGQNITGGLGLRQIAGQKEIAQMESETARRGQDMQSGLGMAQVGVERDKIAAAQQPKGLPGVVQHEGIWGTVDDQSGEFTRLPDAEQNRLSTVRRIVDSLPRSIKRKELDAYKQNPDSMVPVYDYQTGQVAMKPANTRGFTRNWQDDKLGDKKTLRYQPLAMFDPTAYQAFLEWADAYSGAAQ